MLLAVAALLAVACGDSGSQHDSLTVFAASSLTDAFTDIGAAFEAANPGVSVEFNFGGSPALVTQIDEGARADVLATASEASMNGARDRRLVADPTNFAHNQLAVIVPADNPADIASPFDLANDGVTLVIAQEGVPAGDYAREVFQKMEADMLGGAGFADRVLGNVVSEEANVKAVAGKVQLGEADAGIVYVTDVTPDVAGEVTLIAIPDTLNVLAAYPIAVTFDAEEPEIAQAFVDFVLSEEGQRILQQYGFLSAS